MNDYTKIVESVRLLADGQQPNENISKLLYDHNCFYLLSKVRGQDGYSQKLQVETRFNKISTSERYKACQPILEELEKLYIPYAIIKGAVLSKVAYGDIKIRKSGDIDLLLQRKDVDIVKKIMLKNGFVQGRVTDNGLAPFSRQELIFQSSLSHQMAPFIKKSNNMLHPYIHVDVNFDILWGESKQKADMEFILSKTENMQIYGVVIKKLTPAMEFIALCLHHYKHINSIYLLANGDLKLSMFCDIFFYIKNNNILCDELIEICSKLNVTEYIYYCIFYTNEIFKDECLADYLSIMQNDKSKYILNTFGLNEQERKLWSVSFEERLFCDGFNEYFMSLLDSRDREKIHLNVSMF
ncbi:nucleotidyltransferase family protein [Clostridium beijerinckii]|uniref:nucleotidyltransferase family protein n=1 Tax=Clostridium beijerinckii TaxID=1520 RepID=UPI0022E51245|nr:nucleotidyltransferase family protein [Clostridium beijerinckii]